MRFCNQNVIIVMKFFHEKNYGVSAVCAHKKCYRLLKDYMRKHEVDFLVAICHNWYNEFGKFLSPDSNGYKDVGIAVLRFQDVYKVGYIKNVHITLSKPTYA